MELIERVAGSFIELIPEMVKAKRAGVMIQTSGSPVYLKHVNLYSTITKFLRPEARREFLKRHVDDILEIEDPAFAPPLLAEIDKRLKGSKKDFSMSDKKEMERVSGEAYFSDSIKTPLSKMKLIINLRDLKKSFLYDTERDLVHQYDYEIISKRLKSILGDSYDHWVETNSEDCVLEYRPMYSPRIHYAYEIDQKIFNLWTDAEYKRDGWEIDFKAECPPEVLEFLAAFAPREDDQRALLSWLRDSTFDRAEPILILCGKPGVGKNIFVEHLAASLVGRHNYRSASRGFNRTQFHNNVSQCRLFFLDEMSLSPDTRETLKSYHNGTATIERKGKDVGDPEKIYASFVIANNHPNRVKLEFTDRKFYVPILSQTPLPEAITKAKVDRLVELCKNSDFLRQLASYLYITFKSQEATNFPKNPFFKDLCINSYPFYFRRFLHMVFAKGEVSAKEFNKAQKTSVDLFDLRDHIQHYESQFSEYLCDFHIHENGTWTAVRKKMPLSVNSERGSISEICSSSMTKKTEAKHQEERYL
jgi:hypothetical protein